MPGVETGIEGRYSVITELQDRRKVRRHIEQVMICHKEFESVPRGEASVGIDELPSPTYLDDGSSVVLDDGSNGSGSKIPTSLSHFSHVGGSCSRISTSLSHSGHSGGFRSRTTTSTFYQSASPTKSLIFNLS